MAIYIRNACSSGQQQHRQWLKVVHYRAHRVRIKRQNCFIQRVTQVGEVEVGENMKEINFY